MHDGEAWEMTDPCCNVLCEQNALMVNRVMLQSDLLEFLNVQYVSFYFTEYVFKCTVARHDIFGCLQKDGVTYRRSREYAGL